MRKFIQYLSTSFKQLCYAYTEFWSSIGYPKEPWYRWMVGAVVVNAKGEVMAFSKDHQFWVFSQGGLEKDEDILSGARRELYEETGLGLPEEELIFLGKTKGAYAYNFKRFSFSSLWRVRGFLGQKGYWTAFLFLGKEDIIAFNHTILPEFRAWRWMSPGVFLQRCPKERRSFYTDILKDLTPVIQKNVEKFQLE